MSPHFNDGDYVIISSIPLLFNRIKENSIIVFNSPVFGILIKKVSSSDYGKCIFYVKGFNPASLSSEKIGPVKKNEIIGTVLLHIKRK
jgi:signal peptidase I